MPGSSGSTSSVRSSTHEYSARFTYEISAQKRIEERKENKEIEAVEKASPAEKAARAAFEEKARLARAKLRDIVEGKDKERWRP